ncbi:mechanosensitive ion channel family protein [Desulfosarcina sp.]|uniref:mechanosensitive ion channel family protein n=1 Tax=Desulfosarcina sp. TaxID=2027861 RepID=UPI0029B7D02E|nr:mechanosensitive ion channel family protein [Desulfosarcina sp.]MDX2455322.1 mechanosensitive ion channel family protein [Desulfosarcina sp.]MDX2492849.1 mechanosensitive ion channel family protein [Desulfosarcina sp.]
MQNEMSRLQMLGDTMTQHGTQMALALAILILGLLAARWMHNSLSQGIRKRYPKNKLALLMCNLLYGIIVIIVIMGTAVEFGAKPVNLLRLLTIIALVVTGVAIFLKPFIPTMPFKVGNTVKAGNLLGKVEAITFLNTRMKTFDGKTFFVPNRQILNDIVMNYQFTETRRLKIDVGIRYDQDLLKAKRTLESIMIEDPRVKTKPGPMVYVLNLASSSVDLGGRCWVDNKDYWVARCDLLEKAKLRFDSEGIKFAFPQLDLHINHDRIKAGGSFCPAPGGLVGPGAREASDEENI